MCTRARDFRERQRRWVEGEIARVKTMRVDFSADKYEPGLRKQRHCTGDNDIGRDDRTVRHGNNHCRVYPARIITRSVRTRAALAT